MKQACEISVVLNVAAGLLLAAALCAQDTPANNEATQLATRMLQLMESTAVAVPGLIRLSEPVRQNAQNTLTEMERTPRNAALAYRLINQVRAYLALSDSVPRPSPFPAAADRQYAELREGLQRLQRDFEAGLETRNQAEQKRDTDPNKLLRYADADAKMPPPAKLPRVVFLGDSGTQAWRLNEYFTGRDFVNRGIDGQTTLQMLARFRQDVLSLNPKAVVVLGGSNDIAVGIPVNQIEDNLTTMADLARAHGIKPVFASILPVSDYHKDADAHNEMTVSRPPATILSIDNWLRTWCQSQGFAYLDYYAVLIDSSGHMQADLSDDGLNPNSKGYRVMSPVALQALGRILSGQQEPEPVKRRFHLLGN